MLTYERNVARVCVIHKADAYNNIRNYRPTSVLPFLSKATEHIIHGNYSQYVTEK